PIPSSTTLVQGHPGEIEAPALPPSPGWARSMKGEGGSWRRRLTSRWVATCVGLFVVTLSVLWQMSPPFLPILSLRSTHEVQPPALPFPDKPSLAVLPFVNVSEDPKQEYFSDGMTDTLITDLSKLAGLFVISRNSTFVYKGKAIKPQQVSQDLGVRYVLEGSVQKAEARVRINAQ